MCCVLCAGSLAWSDFRGKVLGPTDPAAAPAGSLRGQILAKWQDLGLKQVPNTGFVHVVLTRLCISFRRKQSVVDFICLRHNIYF